MLLGDVKQLRAPKNSATVASITRLGRNEFITDMVLIWKPKSDLEYVEWTQKKNDIRPQVRKS